MPQLKWYPPSINNNKRIPHGFYIGGLLRYQIIEYDSNVQYNDEFLPTVDFNFNARLESFAIGAEIGYQIEFKNHMLLDFSFLRPRYVFNTISYDSNIQLQDEILDALTDEINDAVGFSLFNQDLETIDLNDKESFSNFGFGYAISVGYRF